MLAPAPTTNGRGRRGGVKPIPWDLNRASAIELAQLPGIGADTVAGIISARPYREKRELVRRNLITADQYEEWKDYLVVSRTR